MEVNELIQRFATVMDISYDEANSQVGAATVEEVLEKIKKINREKIIASLPQLNRAQRRKMKKKGKGELTQYGQTITDTATKLAYINMIEQLREMNKKENEQNEDTNEEDIRV